MKKHTPHVQNSTPAGDQRGIASIIITMVSMVIIALIVIGFATLSRREQRQTLDQQLSAQAFYAAESGVEDARATIKANASSGLSFRKDNCTTNNGAGFVNYPSAATGTTKISTTNGVSYTCLTVDDAPTSLTFDGIGEAGIVVPVNVAAAGPDVRQVKLTWTPTAKPATGPAGCPANTNNTLRPQASWNCGYGLLRTDLTLTGAGLSRANLTANTMTGFFEPLNNIPGGSGQISYGAAKGQPNLVPGSCDQSASYTGCTMTVTNIPSGTHNLSMRLTSLYQPSNLQVEADDSSGNPIAVIGVQATVDVTGKAQDVLRRIKVSLPLLQTGGILPTDVIATNGSICKRYNVKTGYLSIPPDIINADLTNDTCKTMSDGDFATTVP